VLSPNFVSTCSAVSQLRLDLRRFFRQGKREPLFSANEWRANEWPAPDFFTAFIRLSSIRLPKKFSARALNTNRALSFAVMPGRAYPIQFASSVGGTWSNFPAGSNYAVPSQMILNFTHTPPAGMPQRFYRVKLLP
jgi:hypothetical protein